MRNVAKSIAFVKVVRRRGIPADQKRRAEVWKRWGMTSVLKGLIADSILQFWAEMHVSDLMGNYFRRTGAVRYALRGNVLVPPGDSVAVQDAGVFHPQSQSHPYKRYCYSFHCSTHSSFPTWRPPYHRIAIVSRVSRWYYR